MSKKICRRDQDKLAQILEQVEAVSDVVDELRIELSHLKKISFNANQESVCFEIDHASPSLLRNFENIGVSTRIDETCELKDSQVLKKRSQESIRFSTIYSGLKYFKNKIVKNILSVRKIPQSPKNTKDKCVTSSQEQQREVCLLRRTEEQTLQLNRRNEDKNKYTCEDLDNSADTLFTCNASAQTNVTVCSRQNNEKSYNCNCLTSRNIIEDKQTSPLAMINDDRSVISSDRFADKLSKKRVRPTFLKNKIKRYRRCSCGEQCLYALYKLPCDKYRYSMPEKKINDAKSGLTLKKKDFIKFINVNTIRNAGCFTDSVPVEIEKDESSTSSLWMDLEVDVCNDNCNLEDVDEFTKRAREKMI